MPVYICSISSRKTRSEFVSPVREVADDGDMSGADESDDDDVSDGASYSSDWSDSGERLVVSTCANSDSVPLKRKLKSAQIIGTIVDLRGIMVVALSTLPLCGIKVPFS